MKTPCFSVIVPVYNVENYLAQCLDSLLGQTYRDFEVIVVDDVSTDSSREIAFQYADRYPEQIRLVLHQTNKGLGGARNTGIQAAAGQYLMFLDSDDYLLPETLKKVNEVLQKQQAQIVEFCFRMVDEKGGYLNRMYCLEEDEKAPVLLKHTVNACNKAIHRQLFESQNIRFPEKRYYEDYWTIPKLLLNAEKTATINEDLYCYRQRTESIIHDTNIEKNRDILLGTDHLVEFVRQGNYPAIVMEQLEYLATVHILYYAILRVNEIDWRSPMQKTLKDYVDTVFPDHSRNPYLCRLRGRQRRLLKVVEQEHYGLLNVLWHYRNRVTGTVKKLFRSRR